eukprot:TRINITY_DN65022_c0_g1_i1.p1 TRINITY_DN65022_c0_g1~~TRINITY_DN65022_c0_g1_i1.p1  ORF type:complete len:811 (+),score=189.78 TRINITY_DN65022_c0_g1_i1:91-2433(+)
MLQTADQEGLTRVLTETSQAPHNAVKAEKLSVFIGARCLLKDTELKIAEHVRTVQVDIAGGLKTVKAGTAYGLVGRNGCGKSTLLSLIAGGQIPVPQGWDVFLVGQHLPPATAVSPVEEVLNADRKRAQLLELQTTLEEEAAELAKGDAKMFAKANGRLHQLRCELSRWDVAEREVTEILVALGFQIQAGQDRDSAPTISTPVNELSGGWRMKIQLAKALWLKPKLLLLDEPSNHLDFHALQWLTEQIEEYPHTTVVVSHEVGLLHAACQEILWMKDQMLESMPRDIVSQDDLIAMQRSRLLKFEFMVPEGDDPLAHGISLHGLEFSYGGGESSRSRCPQRFHVKGDVRFSGKSRAVLLGRNGSGKSTFLDMCVGKLLPDKGTVDRTAGLKIGHYSQLTEELDRLSELTAAEYLLSQCREGLASRIRSTRASRLCASLAKAEETEASGKSSRRLKSSAANDKRLLEVARGVLSHFGFDGDVAVGVPVDRLSGGQKACLKFAVLSLRPAHILLLDEPTNHLDAEACKALADGLSNFKGGIVAVTHDELLIYRLIHCNWSSSELLLCQDGCLRRERNFSAQCLKSVKEEVRKAEEAEKAAGRPGAGQKVKELPPEPTSEQKKPDAMTGGLPPWLMTRRRRKAVEEEEDKENAVANSPSNTPQKLKAQDPSEEESGVLEGADSLAAEPSPQVPGMVESLCQRTPTRHSGHSRFRKDLVNLNKAAAKWLRQEAKGELMFEQLVSNIRGSVAAQHLRALHGADFNEEQFVQDVLSRSGKAEVLQS